MKPIAAALIAAAWWHQAAPLVWAQVDTARPPPPRSGAELRLPLLSFLVPGLGQYVQGAPLAGAGFSGVAVAGAVLYLTGDPAAATVTDLPRDPDGQRSFIGLEIGTAAGMLSAYDSFDRSLPALRRAGKYDFMTAHDSPARLLLAPFDVRMLQRWTTWIDLAHTTIVVIAVLNEKEAGAQYYPFRTRDGVFSASLSYGAGVGEEALFRGWLYPVLHQKLGRRAWLSNGLQAGVFGGLHASQAGAFALDIAGWAFYEGWLTQRNGWSIREGVFHHFWYDVAVFAATLLTQKSATVGVAVPVQF